MKKIMLSVCCLAVFGLAAHSQGTIAIVDTKYILDKMPEYKDAQKRLDQQSMIWQKEIDDKQATLTKNYRI